MNRGQKITLPLSIEGRYFIHHVREEQVPHKLFLLPSAALFLVGCGDQSHPGIVEAWLRKSLVSVSSRWRKAAWIAESGALAKQSIARFNLLSLLRNEASTDLNKHRGRAQNIMKYTLKISN